jgi:hypothetical protein
MIKPTLFILIIACSQLANGQYSFRTREGHIIVSGIFDTTQFIAESHKLFIIFNNDYKDMNGTIFFNTIISGIPEIDSLLTKSNSAKISFEGNVPVDFLSWEHKELNLTIPIRITINDTTHEEMLKAEFNHLQRTSTSTCLFSGFLKINLSKYTKDNIQGRLNPELNIILSQLVLRKE